MGKSKKSIPQVALLMQLSLKGQYDLLRGILNYAKLHGPWRLYHMEGRSGEQGLRDLKRWGCTGIISGPCSLEESVLINDVGVPVIVCEPTPEMRNPAHPLAKHDCMCFDSYGCGKLAAEYFLNRQYKNFAFVGDTHNLYWSQEREKGFRETVEQAGGTCITYEPPTKSEMSDWAVEQPRMQKWLKLLLKPTAIFAAMDGRGKQVLDACMGADIPVPDQVAVLGVDDDELICEATFPTMSSIKTTGLKRGFQIAEHLDRLMRGKRLKRQVFTSMSTCIVPRESTDIMLIPDPQIANALQFIWREAGHRAIHVPDVVKYIGGSRRSAEIRFKTIVGRTILEEILRVRLERVSSLLSDTNRSVSEITRECGFDRQSYLAHLFMKHFGCTMSAYRSRMSERG